MALYKNQITEKKKRITNN